MPSEIRCIGCGKVIADGEETVRIEIGTTTKGKFKPVKEWGLLHRSPCFNRSIDSPEAVLDEIRRQSGRMKKAG
jgi:DNA-directed RNA polymerase subunit N (RpoN/RPB10)